MTQYAGCGPAATHFLCFAKESKQRKATTVPLPLRGPRLCRTKNGKWAKLTSLRCVQTTPTSFSIFCPAQTASSQWTTKHSLFEVRHIRFFNKAVAFDVPAFGVAKASDGQTGPTAQTCLSVASWFATPAGYRLPWGPAQRATTLAVAFFCLLFLAKQEK